MRHLSLFFIFLVISLHSTAEESVSFCYEEWTPYAYTEDAKHTGEVIEFLTRELENQSVSIELYEYPFSRCVLEVNKGKVDFTIFVDNEDGIKIIEHRIVDWQIAVISTNEVLTKQSFIDAMGAGVVVSNDYEYPKQVTTLLETNNKQILPASYFLTNDHEIKSLFNLIAKEHAAFMVADRVWAQSLITKYDFPVFVSKWDLATVPQYIGFSKHTNQSKIDLIKSILKTRFKTND